jgi:hypothetical protein
MSPKPRTGAIYKGWREGGEACVAKVLADGRTRGLNLMLHECNHSPSGAEWGYNGSGPAHLAFAICFDATRSLRRTWGIYQRVKERLVSGLPREGWEITRKKALAVIQAIEKDLDERERRKPV